MPLSAIVIEGLVFHNTFNSMSIQLHRKVTNRPRSWIGLFLMNITSELCGMKMCNIFLNEWTYILIACNGWSFLHSSQIPPFECSLKSEINTEISDPSMEFPISILYCTWITWRKMPIITQETPGGAACPAALLLNTTENFWFYLGYPSPITFIIWCWNMSTMHLPVQPVKCYPCGFIELSYVIHSSDFTYTTKLMPLHSPYKVASNNHKMQRLTWHLLKVCLFSHIIHYSTDFQCQKSRSDDE